MAKLYSYSDAAKILGRKNRCIVFLNNITGGILLGTAVHAPAVLAWLDAKNEFFELSNELVQRISDKRLKVSRWGRTERIVVAIGITIVSAYFEALANATLPCRFSGLKLAKSEQIGLAGSFDDASSCVDQILQIGDELIPKAGASYDDHINLIRDYYRQLSERVCHFLLGLKVVNDLNETKRAGLVKVISTLPPKAIRLYELNFRNLCAEFPEVAFWANLREHQATHAKIAELGVALTNLNVLLSSFAIGTPASEVRQSLARQYAAVLNEPVLEPGDIPDNLTIPTIKLSYVSGEFRLVNVQGGENLADESLWQGAAKHSNLDDFLAGYITSPLAAQRPLLILGQPGSGKSLLTKVLAGQLPPSDYLPIRVVLRDAPAASDIQEQIEFAIHAATGEVISWPSLARSAGDALPVVFLDGFDELLLATGASQSDYLRRVARFQEREAIDGRPLVVIVTTRSSVADRATVPQGSWAMRLEPFGESRIRYWLDIWNRTNAANFRRTGLIPCSPEAVLWHKDLAEQPLLLLMLALYDASDNALLHLREEIKQSELYERLLCRFAEREILKHHPGIFKSDLQERVEHELRRLSVVAFAMFNRGSLWVTEQDLDQDLAALLGRVNLNVRDLRAPIDQAQIVLGRFFFVYRAQARQDGAALEAYEFLHATFGEYLLARLTTQVLDDLAARYGASTIRFDAEPVDDDLLNALLSFMAISARGQTISFLIELFSGRDPEVVTFYLDLLAQLFMRLDSFTRTRGYGQYEPQRLSPMTRQAIYAANLLTLAVCISEKVNASRFLRSWTDPADAWRRLTLLWRSQLTSSQWQSIITTFSVSRISSRDGRDIEVSLTRSGDEVTPLDLRWTLGLPDIDDAVNSEDRFNVVFFNSQLRRDFEKEAYFQCDDLEDVLAEAVSPLSRIFGEVLSFGKLAGDTRFWTPAYAIEKLCIGQFVEQSAADRMLDYSRCIALIQSGLISNPNVLGKAVVRFLGVDESLPIMARIDLLKHMSDIVNNDEGVNRAVIRSAVQLFDLSGSRDLSLMNLVEFRLKVTTDDSAATGKALVSLWRALGIKAVRAVIEGNRDVMNSVIARAKREDARLWGDFYRMMQASSLVR
jgi:energy-coupling factor transporter ATP-binding protein EcfA2